MISGFGFSLMIGPALTVTPLTFDKHRNVAAGIASSISCISLTLMPSIYELLISHFDWRTTFVLLACFVAQGAVMGSLCFPAHIVTKHHKVSISWRDIVSLNTLLLYFAAFLSNFAGNLFNQLVPDVALSRAMSRYDASVILFSLGMASLAVRILVAVTGRFTRGRSMLILLVAFAIRSPVILMPFIYSFWPLLFMGIIIGSSWGLHATVVAMSVADVFGLDRMPYIVAISSSIIGCSSYASLPFAGEL